MLNWGFYSTPRLLWCDILHCQCGTSIQNIEGPVHCLWPECFGELLIRQHRTNHIPFALQKSVNWVEVNSPPLSVRKHLTLNHFPFSTNFLKNWKQISASLFTVNKYTHDLRLKSSIKHKVYLFPLFEIGEIGPQMSAWISSEGWLALHVLFVGMSPRCCLPWMQFVYVVFETWSWGSPRTIPLCCKVFNPL